MPIQKPQTTALKRKKLLKVMAENDYSPTKVAHALGVSQANISQQIKRYGIHDELLRISEGLGFGRRDAIEKTIEHIKNGSERSLETWFHITTPQEKVSQDTPKGTEVNVHQINILTSNAVESALKKFKELQEKNVS